MHWIYRRTGRKYGGPKRMYLENKAIVSCTSIFPALHHFFIIPLLSFAKYWNGGLVLQVGSFVTAWSWVVCRLLRSDEHLGEWRWVVFRFWRWFGIGDAVYVEVFSRNHFLEIVFGKQNPKLVGSVRNGFKIYIFPKYKFSFRKMFFEIYFQKKLFKKHFSRSHF